MPELVGEIDLFRVGYALPTRKIDAFMVESFINYAKERGVDFIPIDISIPLADQGNFDCIIHKLYGQEWDLDLDNFSIKHANATVIDPPSAIQRLHNRISMLEPVSQLKIPQLNVPNQILIQDSESLQCFKTTNYLKFPMIAKSLLADGSPNAHDMSLVFNQEGLTKGLELEPPMVLQQFVNHGGTMFKVYIADEYVKCVERSSLPDVSKETMEKMALESNGVMSFSKISGAAITCDDGSNNKNSDEKGKRPTPEFLDEVSKGLRKALGLHLFNFDMIRDDKTDGFLVVDINYFPGYEKLPNYESVMTDFFLNIKKSQDLKKMMTKVDKVEGVLED
ncbi:inositol-tetrakisphosphate 1-kinase, ATP-grasp fold, subdomain 1 [Artemisia annua]|uniref:Inositol-tetrakisphosphate 1-kinase n=1 Tax=Artemisia annua TaxID=35608 RepID=A0A2U1PFF2_ARTAN|nr:inositol-tetrakisphosphate 1-kinase, ATP-grasp fold, subdomain 1 [Artemisia annua]